MKKQKKKAFSDENEDKDKDEKENHKKMIKENYYKLLNVYKTFLRGKKDARKNKKNIS